MLTFRRVKVVREVRRRFRRRGFRKSRMVIRSDSTEDGGFFPGVAEDGVGSSRNQMIEGP